MTLLWIALALLLLPALWLLVAPLRRAAAVSAAQRDHEANDRTTDQNLAIYRRRLASLEAARERGDIDPARFEEDRLELERSLLEDTEHLERAPLKSAASGKLAVPLVMVAVVLASAFWYVQKGAEGDLTLYTVQQQVMNDPEASLPMLVERLEEQAARQPDNPNVWRALFPLYRDSGRTAEATRTLERLVELEGRQPGLLAELAQIRYFAAGREMTDEVQTLVDEVLAMDSSQPTVLGMLGIDAFDDGDYETAIDRWRRAIAGMDDPDTADALRQGIRVAQQRLGIAPDEAEQAVAEGPGIAVRVRLADDLAGRLDADATVFVVARDLEGELPPLAVAQARLDELPLTVVLDDGRSMSPQARISQVDEARLMVRVSESGQATPQPGDLLGTLEGVTVGDTDGEPVEVVIDRVVE
ncbi:c-type cytochrome biogenesis protein CcmI [Halomonas rhizosphaerae]|uniref:C-type cytochrome biogenesis protein CcmI n=1 Tax=Halomonas rhizosphaerae TaxID=3043296 RepID=A0ABT6UW89_9GAMM|nr:c-type cytochrome biogenesis protein CcmI [Halomonas rhizosphaerae]MDI5890230.1 c-type cytochrome biogenesis protein CcmI [Halomonas rhizosphaerae]